MPFTDADYISQILDDVLTAGEAALLAAARPVDRVVKFPGIPSWDCVAAGTMINTRTGVKAIEDVDTSDSVWAWNDGKMELAPVVATAVKGIRPALNIKTRHRSIDVTSNHRILKLEHNKGKWSTIWTEADTIVSGDLLVVADSIPNEKHQAVQSIDKDMAWLIGLYVADGNVRRKGIDLCVFGSTRDRAASIISKRFPTASYSFNDKNGIAVSSQDVRKYVESLGLDVRSPVRSVPEVILCSDNETIGAFLCGYQDGDAHRIKYGLSYACTSKNLVNQLRALHLQLGHNVSNIHVEKRRSDISIRNVVVKNALPLFRFQAYTESKRKHTEILEKQGARSALSDCRFTIDRVVSVTETDPKPMYDIEVLGAKSFFADGFVVHNCEMLAVWPELSVTGLENNTQSRAGRPLPRQIRQLLRINVALYRCITAVVAEGIPSETIVNDDGDGFAIDMWVLQRAFTSGIIDGTLFSGAGCTSAWMDPFVPLTPDGSLSGMSTTIELQVE